MLALRTPERYLRILLELEEEGVPPLRARIVDRVGTTASSVGQMVDGMIRGGLVHEGGQRHLVMTDEGRSRALKIMRKHRLAECFLRDVVGLEWHKLHVEANRWQHVISDHVETRIDEMLNHPGFSPFGGRISGKCLESAASRDLLGLGGEFALNGGGAMEIA